VSRNLPERRVRFSLWDEDGRARAAVSLGDEEAAPLSAYLPQPPGTTSRLIDDLRTLVRR